MSSRERRVIHLALRNETELPSESVGVGPGRAVVVVPADMPTPPPPCRRVRITAIAIVAPRCRRGRRETGRLSADILAAEIGRHVRRPGPRRPR